MRGDRIANNLDSGEEYTPVTTPAAAEEISFNYLPWLIGSVWPSTSRADAHGEPHVTVITEMPPQHACSALAKLVRWARTNPVGELQGIGPDAAEVTVRTCQLGMSLAARTMNMWTADDVYALFHDPSEIPVGPEVSTTAVLSTVFDTLAAANPMANKADLVNAAASITGALITSYRLTARTT